MWHSHVSASEVPAILRLLLALFLTAHFSSVAAGASQLKPCSCDCCQTELSRENQEEDEKGEDRFECGLLQAGMVYESPFRAQAPHCDNLCRQDRHDAVLTATEVPEIDTERFCFFECEPKPKKVGSPKTGDLCQHLSMAESRLVRDHSGNARPPMENPRVMVHFLAARSTVTTGAVAGDAAPAPGPAPGPAGAKSPWISIAPPAPDQSATLTQWADSAKTAADKAVADAKKIQGLATTAAGALPAAIKAVADAKRAALEAHMAEKAIRLIRDRTINEARQEAFSAVPKVIESMKKDARDIAAKEAAKKRKEIEDKMKAEIPDARAKAAAPYTDAMSRAGAMAAEYQKRAGELASASSSAQMNAVLKQGESNGWVATGDQTKAATAIQESRQLMNLALSMNSQATSYYGTAQSIMGSLGGYVGESMAAAYNAEILLNPDAPNPPPLVK